MRRRLRRPRRGAGLRRAGRGRDLRVRERPRGDRGRGGGRARSVRPGGEVLHVCQHRLREKGFLRAAGLPVPDVRRGAVARATSRAALAPRRRPRRSSRPRPSATTARARSQVAPPGGRGSRIRAPWAGRSASSKPSSLSSARSRWWPRAARDGDLRPLRGHRERPRRGTSSTCPWRPPACRAGASRPRRWRSPRAVLERLEVVGVLCVEMFVAPGGRLLVNELAPRPHNSGHLTDRGLPSPASSSSSSARSCGLPLGATELLRPAAMANLLGDLWAAGEPDWRPRLRPPRGEAPPLRKGRSRGPGARWATSPPSQPPRRRPARVSSRPGPP